MKPSTQKPYQITQGSSAADTTTVSTLTSPGPTAGVTITVETTGARVTFDGSTPSSTNGHVFPKDQVPAFYPFGQGMVIKWTSTAAAVSTIQATWSN